ncbi:hypothetical protein [Kitasatospora sp. NPDC059827]|uniref:DUF7878 domain-containing protein n=1 Tax=Kitasatospora sp. NPDC059827 TaxID=3346964 RepID=UPI003663DD6D
MEFACWNFGAPDLARRGLTAGSAPVEVLLVDIEADLVISDASLTVWSEDKFPVAELARALSLWLRLPDGERGNFTFDSMSYEVPGAVQIMATDEVWRVGSVFAPDTWSSPAAWVSLVPDLVAFVEAVRGKVTALGIEPDFIPGP